MTMDVIERLKRFEIPGHVTVLEGSGELPKVEVDTDWSTAEIYLNGATVTDFRLKGEPRLLFTSQFSRFAQSQAIRGGIPIVFPWFGAKEGGPAHGFARIAEWELHEATTVPEGGVTLRFGFAGSPESATWPPFMANYVVTVARTLELELLITNASADQPFTFEACLHSYFSVGDINAISVSGLEKSPYLDKADHFAPKTEPSEAIRVASEVDRIYCGNSAAVEIVDPNLARRIRVAKTGARSTIVWNPWMGKSQQMLDFGNDEYKGMVCVESGNVADDRITLAPGKTAAFKVSISSDRL